MQRWKYYFILANYQSCHKEKDSNLLMAHTSFYVMPWSRWPSPSPNRITATPYLPDFRTAWHGRCKCDVSKRIYVRMCSMQPLEWPYYDLSARIFFSEYLVYNGWFYDAPLFFVVLAAATGTLQINYEYNNIVRAVLVVAPAYLCSPAV